MKAVHCLGTSGDFLAGRSVSLGMKDEPPV